MNERRRTMDRERAIEEIAESADHAARFPCFVADELARKRAMGEAELLALENIAIAHRRTLLALDRELSAAIGAIRERRARQLTTRAVADA